MNLPEASGGMIVLPAGALPATSPGFEYHGSYLKTMGGAMERTKLLAIAVTVIGLLFACGVAGAEPHPRAQHALGVQRILVLAVSFPDVPNVPGLGKVREHVLDEPAGYFSLASYGKTQLQGGIKGWYTLPCPLAEYKVAPENTSIDRQRVRRLVEDAFNAAEQDVVFDRYDHVIVVVGVRTQPGLGYGSVSQAANPGT